MMPCSENNERSLKQIEEKCGVMFQSDMVRVHCRFTPSCGIRACATLRVAVNVGHIEVTVVSSPIQFWNSHCFNIL